MREGPPTPITTVAQARKLQQRRILEARARKEVLPRPAFEDKQPEVIKENASAMEIDKHPKAPGARGTAQGVTKDSAGFLAFSQGAKSDAVKGYSTGQYISYKGVSDTKGKSPETHFSLADFVPGPSQDESSSSNDFRRGARRPKNPPTQVRSRWEDRSKWSKWSDWKE